ncbi:aminotransferase class III-fold pyridoxal phosphate-dependent enzyme [Leucobacter chinensis]|uniref:aminotransferase class III-fold pyridoxal phosphate-dependent enzyme n=1 Tax=Leucobacter chinensis TaxID=2851010 RepID=UPI001C21ED13|nr:aminotransferase class III-fold pyridoxal phosphate-dependent enzyme [Leucobacter chinensis]
MSNHESHATQSLSRKVVTEVPGPKSRELHERRTKVIPPGVMALLPVYIEHAHDAILVDVDGNQFIDCGAGIGVTTVGHTNDAVVEAAREAMGKVTHTLFTVTPYEGYVQVAEYLAKTAPISGEKRTMLVNSGAEAVENAVKIARMYTGRPGVAVLEYAYHGRTMLTSTMNHKGSPYATGFGPRAGDVYRAPNSFPLHDGLTGEEAAKRTIQWLEKTAGAADLACLVAEPIQGEGGFVVPAEGYLPTLAAWCREKGIVFIADEIQSGIARSGKVFATEHFGFEPDMVLTAKGIAGGLPLAGVTGRAEIMDVAPAGGLGGTFGGNPVACAAAVAVFEQLEEGTPLREAQRVGRVLGAALEDLKARHEEIAEVRGHGAMLAIELTEPGTLNPLPELVNHITQTAAQNGVLLLNAGLHGNVLRFLPPVTITDEQIAEVAEVIDQAITSYQA